jgi:transcriptional regulator with XRE-family HTH domain
MRSEPDPFGNEPGDLPPPSLYALEIEGTSAAPEGLLSWVVGLAQAHCVSPRTLVRHLLSCSDEYRKLWSVSTFFDRDIGTVNGLGRYASMMVALIGLGQTAQLQGMTLLSLAELFPRNGEGFLARNPRWCHMCLCEQARNGVRPHYPLVWSLDYYTVCHVHQVAMSEQCPSCGLTQPFLPSYPSLIHCGCCGESLIAGAPDGFLLGEHEVSEFSIWCGNALADLVGHGALLGQEGALVNLRANIDYICSVLTEGNRKQLCREVGLQPYALKGWMTGERPSLAVLLRLCYGIQAMPSAMFVARPIEVVATKSIGADAAGQRLARPRLGFRERERIKNLLDVVIADRDDARRLIDIAQQTGISRSALKYWFRNECRELVLKRRAAEDRRILLKYRESHLALRSVVQNLRAQKINLSRWQVEPELRENRASLIRPDLFKSLEWMRISQ